MNTENNRIIAEFMGLKPVEVFGSYSISKDHVSVNCKTEKEAFDSFCKSTKYHSDWNWLMEVVEKIEKLGNDLNIYAYHSELIYDGGENIKMFQAKSKIEATYNACVVFIKWHNEQN